MKSPMTPEEAAELLDTMLSGDLMEVKCCICNRRVREHTDEEVQVCLRAPIPDKLED